jgi:hypothetical protein
MVKRTTLSILVSALLICTLFVPSVSAEAQWDVKIKYNGEWSGSVGGTSSASYDGTGDKTISVSGDIISAVIQKGEDNSDELCVEIWRDGLKEESSCTTAGYGVVSVSASNFEDLPGFGFMGAIAVLGLAAIATMTRRN